MRDKLKEFEMQENLIFTDMLFCDYAVHWLQVVEKTVDIITFQGYKGITEAHIIPYFKDKGLKLSEIKRADIQQYVDVKFTCGRIDGKGGLSPKTVKRHKLIIQFICKEAIKNNLILKNPANLLCCQNSNGAKRISTRWKNCNRCSNA